MWPHPAPTRAAGTRPDWCCLMSEFRPAPTPAAEREGPLQASSGPDQTTATSRSPSAAQRPRPATCHKAPPSRPRYAVWRCSETRCGAVSADAGRAMISKHQRTARGKGGGKMNRKHFNNAAGRYYILASARSGEERREKKRRGEATRGEERRGEERRGVSRIEKKEKRQK